VQVKPVFPVDRIADRNYSRYTLLDLEKKKNKFVFDELLEKEMKKYALSISSDEGVGQFLSVSERNSK
jgi:hypothetical protein